MTSISDLLRRKGNRVHVVTGMETVASCARMMTERQVGSLVIAEGTKPLGIVTWHDMLAILGHHPTGLDEMPVSEIMTTALETADEADDLDAVKKRMVDKRIRHMPVLRGDVVVGLVTLIDVMHLHLRDAHAWNEELQSYIYGPRLRTR